MIREPRRRWAAILILAVFSGYMLGDAYMFWFLVIPAFFNSIAQNKDVNRHFLGLARRSGPFLN